MTEILGMGAHIAECPRIGRMIERHGELFLRKVFHEEEIRHCQSRVRSLEHLTAWWSAKEAILMALGASTRRRSTWTDLRLSWARGQIEVELLGGLRDWADRQGVRQVRVSAAHCRTYATAQAISLG